VLKLTTKQTKKTQINAYNRIQSGHYKNKVIPSGVLRQAARGFILQQQNQNKIIASKQPVKKKSVKPVKKKPIKLVKKKPIKLVKKKPVSKPVSQPVKKIPVQIQTFKTKNTRSKSKNRKYIKLIDLHTKYIQQNKVKTSYIVISIKSKKYGIYRNKKFKLSKNINTKSKLKKFIDACVIKSRKKLPGSDDKIAAIYIKIDEVY
jgi:hypothetical protein